MFHFIKKKRIQRAVTTMSPELQRRYGRSRGCTLAQLRKTALDLGYEGSELHYLCYCFLSEDEFKKAKRQSFFVNWKKVEEEAEEFLKNHRSSNSFTSNFYESGIGSTSGE